MANNALRQEVDTLREYMKELSYQAMRTDMAVARLSDEMREFKDEMREFKDEMREFKDEMRGFKDEMRGFKDEMRGFKDESRRERQQMNKQWGDLANRLGTLVEDIVAPNLPRVAAELFSCDQPDLFAVRVIRRFQGETREYDAIVVCPDVVLVNETKSRLLDSHVGAILEKLADLPRFFPEYAARRTVGILASLYPEPAVIRRATRKGVLVMGMGDETMEVLNPEAAAPKVG
jgi:Sec-independent protein translocase protein TatA